MGAFELIVGLTSRLASSARPGEIATSVAPAMAGLGFGLVWIAVVDDQAGSLATLCVLRDGTDITRDMAPRLMLDARQPLPVAVRERRWINVADPAAMPTLERDDDRLPAGTLGLTRVSFDRVRGQPFACGPLLGADGEPIGALCLGSYRGERVIPDELFAHGELRAAIDLLAMALDRARQRERLDATSAALARAQATLTADAHIKSVGELAAATTHDLNHLCTVMQGAIEISARSADDAVAALPRIARAHRAIIDLVARLRRIASPAQPASDAVDLAQIVDDVVVAITARLRERTIEVECALPDPLPAVRCDPTLLRRVVLNLLSNAEDALAEVPVDRRHVHVRAREDAGTVRLLVTDTGPGIPPQVMARLFQSGFTTKRDGHMGLGLAACQAELAPFGARLEARNAITGGAEFELVVLTAGSAAALPGAPASAPAAPAAIEPRDVRVLVIDDDPDIVDIILVLLEPIGYQVATATTSAHALELAARQPFDIVLCDISMPKQSGLEISRALRTTGYDGKIVLMTGLETPTLSSDVRDAESDRLLRKPFTGGELLPLIESLIRA
ncbi:MAG TPA: response regulator [Kofleriaceae bacterium]|nr:response regulator [Kofleriaceae bacterium]